MSEEPLAPIMERFITAHPALAELVIAGMRDEALPIEARAALTTAARYGVENNDLISDDLGTYGLLDDLFVTGIQIAEFLFLAGEAGTKYREKLVGGERLSTFVAEMQKRFPQFWRYCKASIKVFDNVVRGKVAEEEGYMARVSAKYADSLPELAAECTGVKIQEDNLRWVLERYQLGRD